MLDHVCDVDEPRPKRLLPREGEQLLGDPFAALGCPNGRFDERTPLVVGRQTLLEQVQVAQDDAQQVIEIMGDAAGELADDPQLLALMELRLQRSRLGDVDRHGADRAEPSVVVAHRKLDGSDDAATGALVALHFPDNRLSGPQDLGILRFDGPRLLRRIDIPGGQRLPSEP